MIEYYDERKMPLDDLMAVRKKFEYFAPGLVGVLRNSARKIYPECSKYVDVLLLEEIFSGKIPSEDVLKKRIHSWAYVEGKLFDTMDEVRKKYSIEIEKIELEEDVLKGSVAFPGKVRGEVHIINRREDMDDFQEGQVLVASTTTPDFLPAMKKAGAIISEHGGVICHASITSRELKIPCVVGVKGATGVLKDGDLVEVNANDGIVRRLENEKV